MKRLVLLILLPLLLMSCGSNIPRPTEESLKTELAILVNRAANTENQSWNNDVVSQQINAPLPQGKATSLGWMLEWQPRDGGLAYAIIPWAMLNAADPGIAAEVPYGGGTIASKSDTRAISDAVRDQLGSPLVDVIAVHSIRLSGEYAVFAVTPLLPMADDGYGFAQKVNGSWQVLDLGSSDVGCGIVPTNVLDSFKVRCSR